MDCGEHSAGQQGRDVIAHLTPRHGDLLRVEGKAPSSILRSAATSLSFPLVLLEEFGLPHQLIGGLAQLLGRSSASVAPSDDPPHHLRQLVLHVNSCPHLGAAGRDVEDEHTAPRATGAFLAGRGP
jgi:hypothetical protein